MAPIVSLYTGLLYCVCFLLFTDAHCVLEPASHNLFLPRANCLGSAAVPLAFPRWRESKGQPPSVQEERDWTWNEQEWGEKTDDSKQWCFQDLAVVTPSDCVCV